LDIVSLETATARSRSLVATNPTMQRLCHGPSAARTKTAVSNAIVGDTPAITMMLSGEAPQQLKYGHFTFP